MKRMELSRATCERMRFCHVSDAMKGSIRGYNVIIVMCEIQSVERRMIMQALGAELVLTPRDKGTKGAKTKLNEIWWMRKRPLPVAGNWRKEKGFWSEFRRARIQPQ